MTIHRWITRPWRSLQIFTSLHRDTWGKAQSGPDGPKKLWTNVRLAAFLGILFAVVGCERNTTTITEVPPPPPVEEEGCVLPQEVPASMTPALPNACAGNACVANRSIDATSPPFVAATWTTPGATQTEHFGINGTVNYPFTDQIVTHEWSVLACTDHARLCCRGTNGGVTFND